MIQIGTHLLPGRERHARDGGIVFHVVKNIVEEQVRPFDERRLVGTRHSKIFRNEAGGHDIGKAADDIQFARRRADNLRSHAGNDWATRSRSSRLTASRNADTSCSYCGLLSNPRIKSPVMAFILGAYGTLNSAG